MLLFFVFFIIVFLEQTYHALCHLDEDSDDYYYGAFHLVFLSANDACVHKATDDGCHHEEDVENLTNLEVYVVYLFWTTM